MLSTRQAKVADLPTIVANEQAAYPFPWSEAMLRDSLSSQYLFWAVCSAEQQLVGHLIAQPVLDECHLLNVCLHPKVQGNGYGRALLEQWLQWSQSAGCTHLWLEVRQSNIVAERLYRALGFQRQALRKNYYQAGPLREDGWVMSKHLDAVI